MLMKMCKGREQDPSGHSPSRCYSQREETDPVSCELCNSRASLYCQADDAVLCGKCDRWVHGANFLAQRHIRCLLCSTCQSLTRRYLIGTSTEVILPAIVRLAESGGQCNSDPDRAYFKAVKEPFLFL